MKKSICIISPSLHIGGIERALVVLANYFEGEGFGVNFISCITGEPFYVLNTGIRLFEPRFNHNRCTINKLIYYPRIIIYLRRTVEKISPEIVLVFGDLFNPLVLIALFGLKFPVFISDRTSSDFKLKFPIPQLKKWLYPRSAGFIAQTRYAADNYRKKFNNKLKIRVIPNALRDVTLYPETIREKIILYVGRLDPIKGPESLLEAFGGIHNRQGWRLLMAGSGPQFEKLKCIAIDLKINDEVIFLGEVTDVDRLYARAGIFVLPSKHEGFPNSLCEAMAAGLPCISFDSFPYEEIFTNGIDGIAVRQGDIDELKANIIRLMENNALRIELGSRAEKISTRLNVDVVGKKVVDFIFGQ